MDTIATKDPRGIFTEPCRESTQVVGAYPNDLRKKKAILGAFAAKWWHFGSISS